MASLAAVLLAHPVAVARVVFACGVLLGGLATAYLSDADLRVDVRAALERAHWTLQAAAAQIRISRQRLGHQLDGTDPLTCLSRLMALEGFASAWIEVAAARLGVVVIGTPELAAILGELRGHKRMAKAQMQETA